MPSAYYTDHFVPKNYYYLIGMKNRFSSRFDIPLISNPEHCDFQEPGFEKNAMKEWLQQYKTDYRNKQ